MYESVIRCDACGGTASADPDDGVPAGWYMLVKMKESSCWDDECEWHFCSAACAWGWEG